MKTILSFYNYKLPLYLVYMLQQVNYVPNKFVSWLFRVVSQNKKISTVISRKELEKTIAAKILIICSYSIVILIVLVYISILKIYDINLLFSLVILVIAIPYILVLALLIGVFFGDMLFVKPRQNKVVAEAKSVFKTIGATKIAVIGSYGKTSMKEILKTILSERKDVAATPGNMNTLYSQAKFALNLNGGEDIVIVEFGEGEPGDIYKMCTLLGPDYAVLTGLSPNHLDRYKTIEKLAEDMMTIYDFTENNKIFVSGESEMLNEFTLKGSEIYSSKEVMGWHISDVLVSVENLQFKMKKNNKSILIKTSLIGRHQIGPVAFGAALAHSLGLNEHEIELGCTKLKPYKHRMQPRRIQGACLIDDTYNGNLEGLKAGLQLLSELDMKRKWYVTPGLVDQGKETELVHIELGKNIAKCNPDIVVLMNNSVRPIIEKSLSENGFTGDLRIEDNPLDFYTNIEFVVAEGDVVLMQNDWTDNYN